MHKTYSYQAKVRENGQERRMTGTVDTTGTESLREAVEAEIAATAPDAELLSVIMQEERR